MSTSSAKRPFTHEAHDMRSSASQEILTTGDTPLDLGEGWRLFRRQDMIEKAKSVSLLFE